MTRKSNGKATETDQQTGSESANKDHNTAARANTLLYGMKQVLDLDRAIDEAKETHVQPLQDKKKKLRGQIRNDLGVSAKVLDLRYKEFKMAADAQAFETEEERDRLHDEMKETFQAMHPGQTVNFVEVAERISGTAPASPR